jgi:hypothetical protein
MPDQKDMCQTCRQIDNIDTMNNKLTKLNAKFYVIITVAAALAIIFFLPLNISNKAINKSDTAIDRVFTYHTQTEDKFISVDKRITLTEKDLIRINGQQQVLESKVGGIAEDVKEIKQLIKEQSQANSQSRRDMLEQIKVIIDDKTKD